MNARVWLLVGILGSACVHVPAMVPEVLYAPAVDECAYVDTRDTALLARCDARAYAWCDKVCPGRCSENPIGGTGAEAVCSPPDDGVCVSSVVWVAADDSVWCIHYTTWSDM